MVPNPIALHHPEMAPLPSDYTVTVILTLPVQRMVHLIRRASMARNSGRPCNSARDVQNDIIIAIDDLGYSTSLDYAEDKAIPPLAAASRDRLTEQWPPITKNHVRLPMPGKTRIHASIRPLTRKHPISGKAGDVTFLDHWIADHGRTTSSYEELPHRIQSS